MIFHSLLLSSMLVGGGELPPPTDTPEAESVLRRYALADFARPVYKSQSSGQLIGSSRAPVDDLDTDLQWVMNPDLIQQVLDAFLGEELEYEGRTIWQGDRTLMVRAPEALHAEIRNLLEFLGAATSASIDLQIDVINLQGDNAATPLPAGLVDLAAADKILALGNGSAKTESYRMQLFPGSMGSINVTAVHPFIADYNVEVAEQMGCFDPVVRSVVTGLRMDVGAYPADEGCNLSLLFLHGDATDPIRELNVHVGGVLGNDTGVQRVPGIEKMQAASIAQRSVALNTALPDGKALVIRTTLDLSEARGTQYVILRRSNTRFEAVISSKLSRDRGELHLISEDAMTCPRYEFGGAFLSYSVGASPMALSDWYVDGPLFAELVRPEFGMEDDILASHAPELAIMRNESWIIGYRPTTSEGGEVEAKKGQGAQSIKDVISALQFSSEVVNVSLSVERNGKGLSRQLSCDLPLRVGYPSAITLGVEGTHLVEFDVEIAQKSSMPDPVVVMDLDGLTLVIEPVRVANGNLELRLTGVGTLLREASNFDAQSSLFAEVEERVFDMIQVNETVRFASGGEQSVVLGNSATGGEAGALKLRIQVR